jgi:hypothetical protein
MTGVRWLLHLLECIVSSSCSVVRGEDGYETHVLVWAVPTDAGLVIHRHPYHVTRDSEEGAARGTGPAHTDVTDAS